MDRFKKLEVLGESAKYDICVASSSSERGNVNLQNQNSIQDRVGNLSKAGICHSYLPDGRCVSLFKVLLSNFCENNCFYCPVRKSNNIKRTRFTKDELAKLFMELYTANYVEGIFLSSGVYCSPAKTMSEMIETCEILRNKYKYYGYIHLKIIPSSDDALVEHAMKIANRVSINLEAPNADYLKKIAPDKHFHNDIISNIEMINKNIEQGNSPNAGYTTQLVVGASGEDDKSIMKTTTYL